MNVRRKRQIIFYKSKIYDFSVLFVPYSVLLRLIATADLHFPLKGGVPAFSVNVTRNSYRKFLNRL